MKDKKTVEMLDSIPKFDTYSKCNSGLEKLFSTNCLKSLLYNLKHPRKYENNGLLEMITKKLPEDELENDIYGHNINIKKDEHEKNLLEDDENDDFDQEKIELSRIIKKEQPTWRESTISPKKRYKPNLDPFKYNPNYNSIYKNIPSVKFIKTKESSFFPSFTPKIHTSTKPFLTEVDNKISPKKKNKKGLTQYKAEKSDSSPKANNKKNLPLLTEANNTNIFQKEFFATFGKENHSLRFSRYIPRKDNIYHVSDKVSYLEPYNYRTVKNRSIDFNKMLRRTKNDLINVHSLKVPSMCYYKPKYDLIEKKPLRVIFNEFNIAKENKKTPKYLIQKLWRSYNVRQEYQLIDNNKLNDQILNNLNLEISK